MFVEWEKKNTKQSTKKETHNESDFLVLRVMRSYTCHRHFGRSVEIKSDSVRFSYLQTIVYHTNGVFYFLYGRAFIFQDEYDATRTDMYPHAEN